MATDIRIKEFKKIDSVPLGTEIALFYDRDAADDVDDLDKNNIHRTQYIFTATIIGIKNTAGYNRFGNEHSVLIGLHDKFKNIGWLIASEDDAGGYVSAFQNKISNYKQFMLGWMLRGDLMVGVIDPELEIIMPDQKCSICNRPAPHVKPNLENNFLCSSCKLLGEL